MLTSVIISLVESCVSAIIPHLPIFIILSVLGNCQVLKYCSIVLQQSFGIRTAGLEEKTTACQMLVCYARELKEGFAEYAEEVVRTMVPLLKFYFEDGILYTVMTSIMVRNYT